MRLADIIITHYVTVLLSYDAELLMRALTVIAEELIIAAEKGC